MGTIRPGNYGFNNGLSFDTASNTSSHTDDQPEHKASIEQLALSSPPRPGWRFRDVWVRVAHRPKCELFVGVVLLWSGHLPGQQQTTFNWFFTPLWAASSGWADWASALPLPEGFVFSKDTLWLRCVPVVWLLNVLTCPPSQVQKHCCRHPSFNLAHTEDLATSFGFPPRLRNPDQLFAPSWPGTKFIPSMFLGVPQHCSGSSAHLFVWCLLDSVLHLKAEQTLLCSWVMWIASCMIQACFDEQWSLFFQFIFSICFNVENRLCLQFS